VESAGPQYTRGEQGSRRVVEQRAVVLGAMQCCGRRPGDDVAGCKQRQPAHAGDDAAE